ncbi:MAG: hypothetical protein DMF96_13010 [Acidobacteria bacterium]|nr:MAG: hypothetical protein DMF96_13010 [Acidobacteriota bacterium]
MLAGADLYLPKSVLSDWPGREAQEILTRCAEAARPAGCVTFSTPDWTCGRPHGSPSGRLVVECRPSRRPGAFGRPHGCWPSSVLDI